MSANRGARRTRRAIELMFHGVLGYPAYFVHESGPEILHGGSALYIGHLQPVAN